MITLEILSFQSKHLANTKNNLNSNRRMSHFKTPLKSTKQCSSENSHKSDVDQTNRRTEKLIAKSIADLEKINRETEGSRYDETPTPSPKVNLDIKDTWSKNHSLLRIY